MSRFHRLAQEARQHPSESTNSDEKENWLRIAAEWIRLAEIVKNRRNSPSQQNSSGDRSQPAGGGISDGGADDSECD